MSSVYNLVWLNPVPAQARNVAVALNNANSVVVAKDVEAVILFPSLMMPCVHHAKSEEPYLELLIVSNATVTADHVNRQLKVNAGLAAEKHFHVDALFAGIGDNIRIEAATKDGDGILRTHKKFEGVLHAMFEKRLSDAGFTKFFRVRLHAKALEGAARTLDPIRKVADVGNTDFRAEYHDKLVKKMLEERHTVSGFRTLPERGRFAFKVDPKSGPQPWIDRKDPIVAYHPVYLFEASEPEHLNFGHLTDIHMNYRLDILQHTPVQVIDGVAGSTVSKPIGKLVQPTNQSFTNLLNQVSADNSAHALLIGGDLIDHQANAYTTAKVPAEMEAVWNAVDVASDNQARAYSPGVDIIGFYSLLLRFCRAKAKPVFGIAGNHDAYLKPFGISPRLCGQRLNAGIPADLNLTLYEAVLAFGPTFADFSTPKPGRLSSFDADWMEWFYTVFTPFGDATIQLHKQRIVCLGWGNDEDMQGGGQGIGHLPRADDSVSSVQLKLLQNAAAKHSEQRIIVISHFTVASFEEQVPMLRGGAAAVGALNTKGDENEYNMGTFEQNHDKFLKLLKDRTITCILTGHSHRRGLYFLGDAKVDIKDGSASFPITIRDPEIYEITSQQQHKMPAIIVSDSGGPYPRYNWSGEFRGWGSDKPGGSVVSFAADGSVRDIKVIRAASAKPRLSVAIDYADMEREMVWEKPLQTHAFLVKDEAAQLRNGFKAGFYELDVPLAKPMLDIGLRIARITFHQAGAAKIAVDLTVASRRVSPLNAEQCAAFYNWMHRTPAPDKFVAVHFSWDWDRRITARYEHDPWVMEIAPTRVPGRGNVHYELPRPVRKTYWASPASYPDLPDFDWRRRRYAKPKP